VAREEGALTVGVVTKPFLFEGGRRMRVAEDGITDLKQHVDTLIVIPNQNLFRIASKNTTFAEAFVLADQVLHSGIACITDLIVREGLINLDFADVKVVMSNMGAAMMGMGEASGEDRAIKAAEIAIANPLLDGVTVRGARGLVISIAGGKDLTLYEVDEAASRIRSEVDPEAHIIVGATFDDLLDDKLRVSILASGLVTQSEAATPVQNAQSTRLQAPSDVPSSSAAAPASIPAPNMQKPPSPSGSLQQTAATAGTAQTAGAPGKKANAGKSDGKGDALKKKLSEALRSADNNQPMQLNPAQAVKSGNSAPVNEVWKAPGNVTIEAGPPELMGKGSPPVTKSVPLASEEVDFQPKAPSAHRKPTRRMPAPDDFPVVGQRELPTDENMGGGPLNKESLPKKRGFFERLKSAATGGTAETPVSRDENGLVAEAGEIVRDQNTSHSVQPLVGADQKVTAKARPRDGSGSPLEGGEDIDFPMIFQDRAKGS